MSVQKRNALTFVSRKVITLGVGARWEGGHGSNGYLDFEVAHSLRDEAAQTDFLIDPRHGSVIVGEIEE
jgi:hypothetical protein